jgi:hypothetical protein
MDALLERDARRPGSVMPADWDGMVRGARRKFISLLRKSWPRDAWPAHVPHPNAIALYE